jgi:membrane protein implicated in regulation of membrane protease activity
MFVFFSRSRYGPLVQVAVGLACVVIGLFVLTRILLAVGAVLIVLGIAVMVSRLRARRRERDESAGL